MCIRTVALHVRVRQYTWLTNKPFPETQTTENMHQMSVQLLHMHLLPRAHSGIRHAMGKRDR